MTQPHPKLCLRPRPHPGIKQIKRVHTILGPLVFVNEGDGCWKGTALVCDAGIPLEIVGSANISETKLNAAAALLEWIQKHEPTLGKFARQRLATGEYRSNLKEHAETRPKFDDSALIMELRPANLVFWPDSAEVSYELECLTDDRLRKATNIVITIGEDRTPNLAWLMSVQLRDRAKSFLDRIVPSDLADFEDSLADQLIAKAAADWFMPADNELKSLVREALLNTENHIRNGSVQSESFLKSAKCLLREIDQTIQSSVTEIDRIIVKISVRHPEGKRMPFRKKLVFKPTDKVLFDGSGPSIGLATVYMLGNTPESLAESFRQQLLEATDWLSRQSPAVFQELRAAGFITQVWIFIMASVEKDLPEWSLPPEFIEQCGQHGFSLTVVGTNLAKLSD